MRSAAIKSKEKPAITSSLKGTFFHDIPKIVSQPFINPHINICVFNLLDE